DVGGGPVEVGGGLLDELLDVGQHHDAPAPQGHRVLADGGDQRRLARAGGDHHAGVVVAGAEVGVDGLAGRLLVGSEDHYAFRIRMTILPPGTGGGRGAVSLTVWPSCPSAPPWARASRGAFCRLSRSRRRRSGG